MVLKLKRNLYGLKDARKTWFEHCLEGLRKMGYVTSKTGPCVWHNKGKSSNNNSSIQGVPSIIVCYMDDCIVFSKSKENIDSILTRLKKHHFVFTDESDAEEYLRMQIKHHNNGIIKMS